MCAVRPNILHVPRRAIPFARAGRVYSRDRREKKPRSSRGRDGEPSALRRPAARVVARLAISPASVSREAHEHPVGPEKDDGALAPRGEGRSGALPCLDGGLATENNVEMVFAQDLDAACRHSLDAVTQTLGRHCPPIAFDARMLSDTQEQCNRYAGSFRPALTRLGKAPTGVA